MTYSDYLRERSGECIGLAVARPWEAEAGPLLDLACDYRSLADRYARAGGSDSSSEAPSALRRLWAGSGSRT